MEITVKFIKTFLPVKQMPKESERVYKSHKVLSYNLKNGTISNIKKFDPYYLLNNDQKVSIDKWVEDKKSRCLEN